MRGLQLWGVACVAIVEHFRVAADAAYEGYVKNSAGNSANSVLLGGGVNWTF